MNKNIRSNIFWYAMKIFHLISGRSRGSDGEATDEILLQPEATLPQALRETHLIAPIVEKIYHCAELSRIRERVAADLETRKGNSILVVSPNGDTGASLLVVALGYYIAYACRQKVLLVDCNMCHPDLHTFFNLPQSHGLTDLLENDLSWPDIVKDTGIERLQIITTGSVDGSTSVDFRHFHIHNLFKEIKDQFDVIICDTSPVLQNNCNIASLSSVTDYCILVVKKLVTTKGKFKEAQNVIESGNGKIDAIILNEHNTDKMPLNQFFI
ncbi:capsular exopolysaccharide family [Candidatus Electrothrix aarhusensis]|uniref:Capsular exopolysaccharide family n=1 Tax=Candidatus Electrothrix aarhusensis TaxID=1859131 RepID=A0A3S3R185_9BACT|nr:capsular exopolysaccharide family [Candidatus Electrothrix aarhusensis]